MTVAHVTRAVEPS